MTTKPNTTTAQQSGPSEVKDFTWLIAQWRQQAETCRDDASRLVGQESLQRELRRYAAQYEQCAQQVETILARQLQAAGGDAPAAAVGGDGVCAKCGAPTDPDYGHVGDCKPPKFLGYGPCLCVLTKYCDGYCNPQYEQPTTHTAPVGGKREIVDYNYNGDPIYAPAAPVGGFVVDAATDGECGKCGAPTDPENGHVGDCNPPKFLGYGPCLCVLTKYCDGYCNPQYEQATPAAQSSAKDGGDAALPRQIGAVDWRAEIASIIADDDAGGPTTDREWSCPSCGQWTPRNHPEAHDHLDDCKAKAEWDRRLNWRARLRALYVTSSAAQTGEATTASGLVGGIPSAWMVVSERAGEICVELTEAGADTEVSEVVKEYGEAYGKISKVPLYTAIAPNTQPIAGGVSDAVYSAALKRVAQIVELGEPEVVVNQLRNPPFPDGVLNRQSVMNIISKMKAEMEAALQSVWPGGKGEAFPDSDTARLNLIASEYLHLIPFEMPTGAGDADVGWVVRQSSNTGDVEIARHYSDDPRAAIDAAQIEMTEPSRATQPPAGKEEGSK